MRRILVLVATLAGLLASPAAHAALLAPAPTTVDGFYTPPSPLPSGAPGDTIKAEPLKPIYDIRLLTHSAGFDVPSLSIPGTGAAMAWRFMHLSTTATGEPQALTATLLLPRGKWLFGGPRPIASYSLGGHGSGVQCTPSWQFKNGTQPELGALNSFLSSGYAVVVTDYQRYPTHTFAEPVSTAHAVLDAIRGAERLAAQQHLTTGLSEASPVVITGYSQGGNAAATAAEQQPTYAPDLHLKGSAAGGVPADLLAVARAVDGELLFGTLFMAINALTTAYPSLHISDLPINAAGLAGLDYARTHCIEQTSSKYGYHHMTEYTVGGIDLDQALALAPTWKAKIDAIRIGQLKPTAPVLVYQGVIDPWIPFNEGLALAQSWCATGANVSFTAYPGEHFLALAEGVPQVITWLTQRVRGTAVKSGCAKPPITGPRIPLPDFFL